MSGLEDAKSLGFRVKSRSAGSRNSVIAVSQPRHGVFTRFFNDESEPVVIKSHCQHHPAYSHEQDERCTFSQLGPVLFSSFINDIENGIE